MDLDELKELAAIKLKLDAYAQLYKEKSDALKKEMLAGKLTEMTCEVLTVKLQSSSRREFSLEGVREALGEKAALCIEESVNPKKFDILTKKKDKFLIEEEKLSKCYTTSTTHSLVWDGLDVFKDRVLKG